MSAFLDSLRANWEGLAVGVAVIVSPIPWALFCRHLDRRTKGSTDAR